MLKSVFKAPDEFVAITIREILAANNIEAVVRRFETTWLDGLPKVLKGYWGEVLVIEDDWAEADECVREFLKAAEEGSGLDDDDPELSPNDSRN
jgi:hypothetical protein